MEDAEKTRVSFYHFKRVGRILIVTTVKGTKDND